jgi:hypothetical protein
LRRCRDGSWRKAEDVAREQGVSKHTIYAWKAKYGGMEVRWRLGDECLKRELVLEPIRLTAKGLCLGALIPRTMKQEMSHDMISDTSNWTDNGVTSKAISI